MPSRFALSLVMTLVGGGHRLSIFALSVTAYAVPPLPKGEASGGSKPPPYEGGSLVGGGAHDAPFRFMHARLDESALML